MKAFLQVVISCDSLRAAAIPKLPFPEVKAMVARVAAEHVPFPRGVKLALVDSHVEEALRVQDSTKLLDILMPWQEQADEADFDPNNPTVATVGIPL